MTKIYTSCFANKERYKDMITISIALWSPKDYRGYTSSKLAPTKDILSEYRKTKDSKRYTERYKSEILSKLDCQSLVNGTIQLVEQRHKGKDIVFLCYEKEGDFCHRQLVADWLKENGFECHEL